MAKLLHCGNVMSSKAITLITDDVWQSCGNEWQSYYTDNVMVAKLLHCGNVMVAKLLHCGNVMSGNAIALW